MTTRDEIVEWLSQYPDEVLDEIQLAYGFEEAFLGVCAVFGRPPLAAYDRDKCIEIIAARSDKGELTDEEVYDEAVEFFESHIAGAWIGDSTPVYLTLRDKSA